MPINLALPDCWTFLNAGRVSLIIMFRFGANSISWTCRVKKEILLLHQLIKVAYKKGVREKKIGWLIALSAISQPFNGEGLYSAFTVGYDDRFNLLPRTSKLQYIHVPKLCNLFTNTNYLPHQITCNLKKTGKLCKMLIKIIMRTDKFAEFWYLL